jgi:hypothetical protein
VPSRALAVACTLPIRRTVVPRAPTNRLILLLTVEGAFHSRASPSLCNDTITTVPTGGGMFVDAPKC